MTDLRAKAIEAMARAVVQRQMPSYEVEEWIHTHPAGWETVLEEQTIAFDAQHGIVRVVPPEATEEMVFAGEIASGGVDMVYRNMTQHGDLTKPRE